MNSRNAVRLFSLILIMSLSWGIGYGQATFNTRDVINNLNKTRDSLLDQRQHLAERADQINQQIRNLQQQLDVVNSYLNDTDRNIRDVEDALRRVQ